MSAAARIDYTRPTKTTQGHYPNKPFGSLVVAVLRDRGMRDPWLWGTRVWGRSVRLTPAWWNQPPAPSHEGNLHNM